MKTTYFWITKTKTQLKTLESGQKQAEIGGDSRVWSLKERLDGFSWSAENGGYNLRRSQSCWFEVVHGEIQGCSWKGKRKILERRKPK